jgi:hypothetical protein
MENNKAKNAREVAEEPLAEALNYLTAGWKADPVLSAAITRAMGCLKAGDANDQVHAEILHAYLEYPGSTAARDAAFRLHKAVFTPSGGTAAGLPRRSRKQEHDVSSVLIGGELFQTLLRAEESGKWPGAEVRRLFEAHYGESLSRATQKRLLDELKQIAKDYVYMRSKLRGAFEKKTRLI